MIHYIVQKEKQQLVSRPIRKTSLALAVEDFLVGLLDLYPLVMLQKVLDLEQIQMDTRQT